MGIERKFRLPRIWSNKELKKFAHLFSGDIVNVSGWTDTDKEGDTYKNYFKNAKNYFISNYKSELKGLQGYKNEFYLDLTAELDEKYINRFDVVFNHTTLEHIYDIKKAFRNLCLMSKDIVILIVPFLQQMHGTYGDYWRFTPLSIKKLFEENGFTLLYLSFNNHKKTSVYIFCIATKNPQKWKNFFNYEFSYKVKKKPFLDEFPNLIGCRAIINSIFYRLNRKIRNTLRKILR